MKSLLILVLLCMTAATNCRAQGFIETSYTPERRFSDSDGNKLGKSDLLQFRGRYTVPLYTGRNKAGQPLAWSATVNAMYAKMNNNGEAKTINPKEVLNASLNVSHIRPLSHKWYLQASLGAGIYTDPNYISFKSILANGALIFAYKLRDNLYVGFGAGVTNSYGVPLIMPMGFLKWTTTGRYEVNVEMASSLKLSVARQFSPVFKLTLVPMEMDGMSAVVGSNEGNKIYGATMMKAYIRPEWTWSKTTSAYLDLGGTLLHSVRLSDRSLKGFFNSFGNDDNKYRFGVSPRLVAGIKFKF